MKSESHLSIGSAWHDRLTFVIQASAMEAKAAGGANGKMKQAKLGFKTKFAGKSSQL